MPRGVALLAILLLLILSAIVAAVGLRGPSEPDPARELAVLTGGDPDRGRETIRQNGCPTCHIISGISEAKGLVGPPLDHFASRAYIGGVVPNTPANLVAWIRNPPGIDSMTAMPATGLSEGPSTRRCRLPLHVAVTYRGVGPANQACMDQRIMDRRSRWAQVLVAILSLSAPSDVPGAFAADPRDVELGRRVAAGAGLAPEHTCARCHGALGEGNPEESAPRIAGQPRFYLEKQLRDFAEGTRQSEKMAPVARALSKEQREAVAAYYGSLWAVPYPEMSYADPALIQQGGVLSAIGDEERGIRACEICHADAGVGIPPSFPYLAGQDAAYTERQLRSWKQGARRNDPLEVMAEIARRLSDQEMRALAHYFARVRPPPSTVSSPIPEEPIPPPPVEPSLPD